MNQLFGLQHRGERHLGMEIVTWPLFCSKSKKNPHLFLNFINYHYLCKQIM